MFYGGVTGNICLFWIKILRDGSLETYELRFYYKYIYMTFEPAGVKPVINILGIVKPIIETVEIPVSESQGKNVPP